MKDLNFTPVSVHNTDAQALGEAFSAGDVPSPTARPSAEPETGPWMQTSIKMRKGTRRAVKLHDLEHGIHMQEVIDIALRNYLNSNELPKYRSTEV